MSDENLLTIERLRESLKKKIAVSEYLEITQERVNRFAEATGDFQWIHVDPARAATDSPFKGAIAHGFLTLSLLSLLHNETIKIQNVRYGINCGTNFVRFITPVPVGAQIRAHFTPTEIRELPDCVQVVWGITVEAKKSFTPVMLTEWIIRYY